MVVYFKKFNKNAVKPEKAHRDDFCYDVYATSEKQIAPNVWQYGIGLGFQINRESTLTQYLVRQGNGFSEGAYVEYIDAKKILDLDLDIDFRPRSSVWETGMVLCNCEPTIDECYNGEVKLNFYHVMPNMPRYKVGDKIAQCKLGISFPVDFCEVKELRETDRGDKGLGSTGK